MANAKTPAKRQPRLGRGLSSLILNSSADSESQGAPGTYVSATAGQVDQAGSPVAAQSPAQSPASPPTPPTATTELGAALEIETSQIAANPYQPRGRFADEQMNSLAASIKRQGVLQPLVVCRSNKAGAGHPYVLIAGERRLRAAQIAGLSSVPCVVKSAEPVQMLEWALVENIQRADLNPIERARGYRQYMDRFALSQAELAERLSQPRTTIANCLRILELCDEVQDMLQSGNLSFGHGKVLAALTAKPDQQVSLARRVVAEGLSVRDLERLVAEAMTQGSAKAGQGAVPRRDRPSYLGDLEQRLAGAVGTRVRIVPGRKKNTGRIVLEYYNLDDFDRIAGKLGLADGMDTSTYVR